MKKIYGSLLSIVAVAAIITFSSTRKDFSHNNGIAERNNAIKDW